MLFRSPFERLVEVLNPARSPSRHPLFQVMIGDEDVVPDDWQLPGLQVRPEPHPAVSAKFDLTLGFRQHHDADGTPAGISAHFEYAGDLFDLATVQALAGRLTRLLRQAAADPGRPVSQLGVLTAAERRRLLRDWNDTTQPVPAATLPGLFEQQAARTPHAPAVLSAAGDLTYAELNGRANQLARHLISLGAGPERLVAIVLPRAPALVVAMLAVLKSGAGYVPVDPGYPPDRQAFMLTNAGAMELGQTVCTARAPRCEECPLAELCAWRAAGYPEYDGARAPRQKKYEGSDRQVRGLILRELRAADIPVPADIIAQLWPDSAQLERALVGLLRDGLVMGDARDGYTLPLR